MVFGEDAAFWIVMLLAGSFLAKTRFGKTSRATVTSRAAIVMAELINAGKS